MKFAIILFVQAFFGSSLVGAESEPTKDESVEIHKEVDLLMKQKKAKEAAPFLKRALELNPEDTKALRKLGLIYTLMLNQPEKAKPLLSKGWDLGDIKSLQALATTYIATNDHDGIRKHEKDFLNNFEKLNGAKIICFFIAGQNLDEDLFYALLRKITAEEIRRDKSMANIIAQTANILAENRKK